MQSVTERFLRYIKVDTQSAPGVDTVPSTEKQKELGKLLAEELREIGAENVRFDQYGHVYATVPGNVQGAPSLGFVAHMDTSNAVSGKDVKARIAENYDGGDIVLNEELGIVLSPNAYESLGQYVGQDIIVTDGTTLLGADDKAGVAEIMAMAETLLKNPDLPHGPVQIAFTPDEEVGNGVKMFDIKGFGADFAYTVDGGELGELEFENFNAAALKLTVNGVSIHPGTAKGKMKNALEMGMEFHQMLPVFENPAYTELYEGFYHLHTMSGDVEKAELQYIIRDHDPVLFDQKLERVNTICNYLNQRYGEGAFEPEIKQSYRNMKEQILPYFHLIDNARAAMESLGITPKIHPIRGGTDGAMLSYMGLPCPNLCTGGHNFHGRFEYIPVQSMEKTAELLLKIVELYAK